MAGKAFSLKALFFFFSRIIFRRTKNPSNIWVWRKGGNVHESQLKVQKHPFLAHGLEELLTQTLIFDAEGTLLKSSSLFPYFMLVAFEAGGTFRALVLFLLYPFICMVGEEVGLKIMVFVCFLGVKRKSFRVGTAVLPKFFLEDAGFEGFETLAKFGRKVGVSALPRVMVEAFLRDYLGVEYVVGRELKVFRGYFVGLMEEDKEEASLVLQRMLGEEKQQPSGEFVGIVGRNGALLDHQLFSHCKDIYLVSEAEKRKWSQLSREKYPKPLIFHDGRLAFRPTPVAMLALFMWIPFGLPLAIIRTLVALLLPYKLSNPILAMSGMRLKLTKPKSFLSSSSPKPELESSSSKPKGLLYVCNHRTLLDPVYLATVRSKPVTVVTYSLGRVSEMLSPNRTVRLTRDRERDARMMEKLLRQGDLVVCPEGTTCREPYLLRFSPLFAEMSDDIVPVAMDSQVSMFYGTTATGLKSLDPLFFLMNPFPSYKVHFLEKVCGLSKCVNGGQSSFDVANHVQNQIGRVLGFECTRLTRKDKYLILAGNEGLIAATAGNKSQNQSLVSNRATAK